MRAHKPARAVYLSAPEIHVPEWRVTNEELLRVFGFTDGVQSRLQWIEARTGIRARRWARPEEACSDLAVAAGKKLKVDTARLTHLLLTTTSGDHPSPPTAPQVLHRLGLDGAAAFDLNAACAGFLFGLQTAALFQESLGGEQLVIASEIRSKFLNPKDLSTNILFGDGACGVVVSGTPARFRYAGSVTHVDGAHADLIHVPAGGSRRPFSGDVPLEETFLRMPDGAKLFLLAVRGLGEIVNGLLATLGWNARDVAFLCPHQANGLIIEEVCKRLEFPRENCVTVLEEFGNTSSSSVGLALHALTTSGQLKPGNKIILVAAGGGGSVAAVGLETL